MRYLSKIVDELSREKFVLISGPRQVGKTTLARSWLESRRGLYLNWDVDEQRKTILTRSFLNPLRISALVLDEVHKYPRWKSWLKGLYDRESARLEVVVTGSAQLDIYQKSGDSLLGRYEYLRLHPLSIGELTHQAIVPPPKNWIELESSTREAPARSLWEQLERRSGFPEPFYRDDTLQHRRWSTRRRTLLVREDLRDLSQIRSLALVEHLAVLLPTKVGSPLSVNSLKEDLQVSHDSVTLWLDMLERLYYCFRISPYHRNVARSLRKEQKLYLWDWSQLDEPAARFENMVACHLLKASHAWNDIGYGEFQLHYMRDKEKKEVDFVIVSDGKPVVLLECKLNDEVLSPALMNFAAQLGGKIPQIQLVRTQNVDRRKGNTRIVSADRYLAALI